MSEVGESDCERGEEKASCRDFFHNETNSEIAKGPFVVFWGEGVLVQGMGCHQVYKYEYLIILPPFFKPFEGQF